MTEAWELPWSVVQVRFNREDEVEDGLRKAGWATYAPRETVELKIARRRVVVVRPLFPRYIFAACLEDGDVSATKGRPGEEKGWERHVLAVRRRSNGGSMIRPTVFRAMLAADEAGAYDRTAPKLKLPTTRFELGQLVRVVDGALNGWEVRIIAILSKREVRAALCAYGHEHEFTFDATKLAAA